jgi:CRP/FNR family cyclic AMP-dependent transcriptional regulator
LSDGTFRGHTDRDDRLEPETRTPPVIQADYLKKIAPWSRDLSSDEVERIRKTIIEKSFSQGDYVCHRGDRLDAWTGVAAGLVKLSTTSQSGKTVTLAGVRASGWFGEGSLLKDEPRNYDLVALRETRLVFMSRPTFNWLFENSTAFNRFLVRQFNERLGQFIALVEYDRSLNATARLARSIAWLFNPVLYPDGGRHLEISQEEIGLLSGLSRPVTNKSLQVLETKGLLLVERNGLTVLNLERLRDFGD